MSEGASEYDMFLDGLDDIPTMMELAKNTPASPRRFRMYPNNSHGIDQAFKGHCDVERHTFANHSRDLVRKTSEALDKLSTSNCAHRIRAKPSRPTHEAAAVITQHLKEDDQGGMLYKNLDPYQHGHITQDDFMHILSTKNTGLSRKEMKAVAKSLDTDRSGLLSYSNLYSSLENISSPPKAASSSSSEGYSKVFEESKRVERTKSSDNFDSGSSYMKAFDESRSVSSAPKLSDKAPPPIEVAEPYKPYDGLEQYFNYQTKIDNERREIEEKKAVNESKYGDAFDRVTLIEKPSNNFAPNTSVKVKDNVERYARGSGNIPSYSTPASINDVVFNRFVVGRDGKKADEVFHTEDVIGTVAYDDVNDILSPKESDGNKSDDASSYSKTFKSLRSTLSPQKKNEGGEFSRRERPHSAHHRSFVPLPTKKVTGAADPYERNFIGNPNTGRNRNSRAFHNSFIYDHSVPARLRRNSGRSHSAPPGKRHYGGESHEIADAKDARLDSVGSLFRYIRDCESGNKSTSLPSPVRVNQKRMSSSASVGGGSYKGEPERKKFADFACAPALPPKKKVTADSDTIKKSLNTLTAQLNNHSKIKILNHKMKKIDVSKSGYVNKSEFSSALKEMGVKISPQQVTTLYEQNAKDNVELDATKNTSLKLCSHQRGINVEDFIQKMRTRTSSSMLAARHHLEDTSHTVIVPTDESSQTPLEREDTRVWKKVVEALSEENSGGKRIIADFFKDAQLNHDNAVPADKLYEELNHIGSKVNDVEFKNMLSNVKRTDNGDVDVDDFSREYHKRSVECRDNDKWMTFMPALSSAPPTVEVQGAKLKRVLKTQKKHFIKKQGAESAKNDPNYRTGDFNDRLNDPVVSATHSFEKGHVPACLTMSDAKEFRLERLKWSKLSSKFLNHKNSLLNAFGGEEGINAPLTETAMKDKLYEAGVLLGNDDIKILQSYAITSSKTSEGNKDLTFGKMCSSMGLNLEKDNRRRMTLSSSADFESDSGIFGSATRSLLSNPNFQSTMLATTPSDIKLINGNRKKRLDNETGKPMAGAPKNMPSGSASEFWEMKHVPEIKCLPAEKLSYHQRLGLPKSTFESTGTSINGSSGRGFTSLRQIKEERKRSSSAPPRYSTLNRSLTEEQNNARAHVWERDSVGRQQAKVSAAPLTGGPSRFASAPLAEYITMRQQQRMTTTTIADGSGNNAPMTTMDLQVSHTSSAATEIDARA
mmetsp:Transcript_14535/g.27191  ORF Transcript_14535/g.27191 Transcript_14535/m.27191 type:complete len:1219 (+) Transcript_14535:99-3755(+)